MNRASTASATVSQAAPPSAAGSPSGAAVQASYQTPVNNTATESTSASSPPRQGEAQNVGRNLDNKNPAWHEPARGGYTD